ncbi:MAG: TetR/AcrR family transcriptional regulator, partial [Tunicatimonas sp.]
MNEQGVNQVSAKTIATRMGISDGNLRYHFRTKEDILYALYLGLVEQLDQAFKQHQRNPATLSSMNRALLYTFDQFVAYRFILLDFTEIMRQYASIRTHYQALYQLRQQQFEQVIKDLKSSGTLRNDINKQQYTNLAAHFNIVSDFWLAHAEILYPEDATNHLAHFAQVAFSLIMPYLTEKGRK